MVRNHSTSPSERPDIEQSELAAEISRENAPRRATLKARSKQSIPPTGRDAKDVNIGVAHDAFGEQFSGPTKRPSTRTSRPTSI